MSEINDNLKIMLDELLALKQRDICADAHLFITMERRDKVNATVYYPYNMEFACPSCKKKHKIPSNLENTPEINFCPSCGQRVKINGLFHKSRVTETVKKKETPNIFSPKGCVSREELTKRGYVNNDRPLLDGFEIAPGPGMNNERVWITFKDDGDFLIYNDAGNEWCAVMYESVEK